MLSDDSYDSLLHLFFKDMVLAFSVDFVEELLLAFFISMIGLLLRHWDLCLTLKVVLEHLVIFSSQGFDSNSDLLAEVIIAVFGEGPNDKLFKWQNIRWLRLWLG